jgi:hypothetical protein
VKLSLREFINGGLKTMRKTTAGKALLGLVNIAFIAIAATAIISAIPPQYNFSLARLPDNVVGPVRTVTIRFNVTNNGFYDIGNFYVGLSVNGPTGVVLNSTQTNPTTIARNSPHSAVVSLDLNETYISANPGNYAFTIVVHSEFALGLIKMTVQAPSTSSY